MKDGSLFFCVYDRKLNAVTTRDVSPNPRMDEYVNSHGEAAAFLTVDATSWTGQGKRKKEDREKRTFHYTIDITVLSGFQFDYGRSLYATANDKCCVPRV